MKVTITGSPKEIAALAVETQRRQWSAGQKMMADKSTEAYKAMVKAIRVLRDVKFGNEDPDPPVSE